VRRFQEGSDFFRLGVYQDGPFRVSPGDDAAPRIVADPADAPFFRFVSQVAGDFDEYVVFARVVGRDDDPDPRLLLPAEALLVELPDYGGLRKVTSVVRAAFSTVRAFWRGLGRVDAVWTFGPQPFELLLVLLALMRRKRVVLGVRQDTPAYFRARIRGRSWKPVLAAIDLMDGLHRGLARRVASTVVGPANAARYGAPSSRVLAMAPSLVPAAAVVDEPAARDWNGRIELLTVGRVDSEKNPPLVARLLAELERRRPGRYHLRWVGTGPLMDDVQRRADDLGVGDRLDLVGFVPFGPDLLELYRNAHAFVHVSLTEGVPQVLIEALASGTPVVATDVGDVRSALGGGDAGLLVPPSDLDALVDSLLRLSDDPGLRDRLVRRGLQLAREGTLEAEAARVARFIRDGAVSERR
jgi:glycosyltransferase involved in cell wall biosynthesis